MQEEWRPIKGYEGYYEVSNLGRVRSVDRYYSFIHRNGKKVSVLCKGSIRNLVLGKVGYYTVSLCKNSKAKLATVHRLMAVAFLPNPLNKPIINHKNGIKTDNRLCNIEWCTYSENLLHAFEHELNHSKKRTLQIKDGVVIKEYPSAKDAAKILGIPYTYLTRVLQGKRKSAYGYQWIYKEKEPE